MSKRNIIRAWKNAEYRKSLSAEERAQLPENPAGLVELDIDEASSASGGTGTVYTYFFCTCVWTAGYDHTCALVCTVHTAMCGTCVTACSPAGSCAMTCNTVMC
jgi:mersacidin/lichenicidin family type 2 lantibiotic